MLYITWIYVVCDSKRLDDDCGINRDRSEYEL